MKVPEPRKLSSGTWFIQLRLGGESISVSALTRADCIHQAQLIKAQHRAGAREKRLTTDKTVRDLMTDYIAALPAGTSPATIRGYKSIQKTRFQSVADITPGKVKDWQSVIDQEAQHVKGKTLKNAWGFLCAALKKGGISAPEVKLPAVVPAEKQWLQPEEILRFVACLPHDRFEIAILLALHGLRRSEILAMTHEKIDLSDRTISVQGAAVLTPDGDLVQKQTNKNVSSRRTVPIMIPELIAAIESIPADERTGLVYTANPTTLYWRINQICEKNGFSKVGVHGLRHSFASLAYHLGLTEQETMELGGWADAGTMRKIYTHLAQSDRLKAKNKIAKFFENANENANDSKK